MLVPALCFFIFMVAVAGVMALLGAPLDFWFGWFVVLSVSAVIIWALVYDNLSTKWRMRNKDQECENRGYATRNNVLGYTQAPRDAHHH